MLKAVAASGSGAAGGITIGTSVITGGTTGRLLYDNGGVVGETALFTTNGTVITGATGSSIFLPIGSSTVPALSLGVNTVGLYSDVSKNVFITNGSQSWTFAAGSGNFNSASLTALAGGSIGWQSRAQMFSAGDGIIRLSNAAASSFGQLDFGGITSSFPAIGISGTSLEFRTADQSSGANAYYHWGGQSRAAAQFDVTSSVTLANVPGLSVNVTGAKTYSFNATIYTTSNIAGGVQAAIGGTATATSIIYEGETTAAAAVGAQTRATALGTTVGGITTVTVARIDIVGTITVNAGGTLTVQFAQNASSGSASSVLVGSAFNVLEFP